MSRRRGLSVVEVLVIVFCIAVVVALVLPALDGGRRRPRRTECLNNLRNIGIATYNYATQKDGVLPPLEDGTHGWPVRLLNMLDGKSVLARDIESGVFQPERDTIYLKIFACPEDSDSIGRVNGLSYAANAGYGFFPLDPKTGRLPPDDRHSLVQDWDGDGEVSADEKRITQATGLFWRPDDDISPLSLDRIGAGDGVSMTLLFAENDSAGPWHGRGVAALGFGIDRGRLTFAPDRGPLALDAADLGPFAPGAEGAAPAPRASHGDAVNAAFADGRATALSTAIDPLVYARLMTPLGMEYGQKAIGEEDF